MKTLKNKPCLKWRFVASHKPASVTRVLFDLALRAQRSPHRDAGNTYGLREEDLSVCSVVLFELVEIELSLGVRFISECLVREIRRNTLRQAKEQAYWELLPHILERRKIVARFKEL